MTIEVAVADAWDPNLSPAEIAEIAARLLTTPTDVYAPTRLRYGATSSGNGARAAQAMG